VLIAGLSGSLRQGSYNTALLRAAGTLLPAGVNLRVFGGLHAVPPYDEDADGDTPPPPVTALREALQEADALLIATPEYNASVPGVLKNALDWASRPYPDNAVRHKPVAVIGASTGLFGAVWAQAEIRKALRAAGANVLERELPIALAAQAFTAAGALRDPSAATTLTGLLAELGDQASTVPGRGRTFAATPSR
jgi:chromate reductase